MLTAAPYVLAISVGSGHLFKALALGFGSVGLLLLAFTMVAVIVPVICIAVAIYLTRRKKMSR